MPDLRNVDIHIRSTSNASDRGFLALADLHSATAHLDASTYRIIGGHMVQMLQHAYPLQDWQLRGTADADAGIDNQTLVATQAHLDEHLLRLGYTLQSGNRYSRASGTGQLDVDILVAYGRPGRTMTDRSVEIGNRTMDSAPGLHLAIEADALLINATVDLKSTEQIQFRVPIPDVEAAVILKALTWKSRMEGKDVADLATLFEITHQHRPALRTWKLEPTARSTRGETIVALRLLVQNLDQGRWREALTGKASTARLASLIRAHAGL
ncbi:hypothetical protein [Nocardia huaxiensis]|uniref:Nucleotidyltransferase AbiEii toxin of type IV toxin-antitoxin system n=1 Tax=Nocardia huaxiensis TaxID=2755382 RepID=A0A7D6ZQE4_9NOCA|nr:hypothetical protein [Nocardia huaxiensis]QLY31185.1 hypothetical protein H0264_01985 [Nocardia huaxiensis]UFS94714.1 hypothetical protein LPY97_28830 [Nocardia huaxiensis]